ncbi:MAG: hypothetical protein J0L75_18650 [Spirochaetes bacterium]|nr:hypothetical protein [Spirochaetota bacterium]
MRPSDPLSIVFLVLVACHSPSPTQPSFSWKWTAAPKALVMTKEDNLYEGRAIGSPEVIQEADGFRMVYAQGGKDDKGRIGMATSSDGVAWSKFGGGAPVFDVGPAGAWDSWFLDTPCLAKAGGVYHLYYFGSRSNGTPGASIGLATTTDGTHFTRSASNPVLGPGPSNAWDGNWVESPVVLVEGGAWKMYYTGIDAKWQIRIGLATSTDGVLWTKYSGNPVLDVGKTGAWDDFAAAVPAVLKKGSTWQIFYCSLSHAEAILGMRAPKIGYAASADGLQWTRYEGNPILTAWDIYLQPDGPYNPCALFDEKAGQYKMWYETGTGFGMATAPAIPGI